MSWHLVDGVPLPDAVGGHPALDFCNTRAGWGSATPKEYLTTARALVLWTADAGLLPQDLADDHPDPAAGRGLRRALRLREALYSAALGRGEPADWSVLSREAAAARAVATLQPGSGHPESGQPGGGGPARWVLNPDGAATPLLALAAIAAAAEDLLTSPLGTVVAACPGRGCGWLFADPRRRRRWCSMAVCGNRAKASRHSARPTSARPPQTSP